MSIHERDVRTVSSIPMITHTIKRREGAIGSMSVTFPVGAPEGEAGLTLVDQIGRNVTLFVNHKSKADFIKGLRAALDEWEKS